jgi:DNA mismatch endonuclease, patch repair protein
MDRLSTEERSRLMARVRSKNTAPEIAVRRCLHAAGLRFRLHRRDLPGRPDVVLPRHRLVIFVHGCFWHGCPNCDRGRRRPASRVEFWGRKLTDNRCRDAENALALEAAGWRVLTVWECQTRRHADLEQALAPLLSDGTRRPQA